MLHIDCFIGSSLLLVFGGLITCGIVYKIDNWLVSAAKRGCSEKKKKSGAKRR